VLDWALTQVAPKEREPVVLGHEPSGEIVAVGKDVKHLRVNTRAVALGLQSFAEYGVFKANRVYPIQPATSYHEALGEPIACVYNATTRTAVQKEDKVVLIGCGFMGLMQLQMMKLAEPKVLIAIDIREDALAMASKLGADYTINSIEHNAVETVRNIVGPCGVDVVVEAVGKQVSLDLAGLLVSFNGRIVIVGFHQGQRRSVDMAMWNWKGIDVINGHERDKDIYFRGMVGGIDMLEAGKLDVETLVTHKYSLENIQQAFENALAKPEGFIKAVVIMENDLQH
jgi:threonine dehydrogenase-like Zn-dependent dehydrogenase